MAAGAESSCNIALRAQLPLLGTRRGTKGGEVSYDNDSFERPSAAQTQMRMRSKVL